MRRHIESKEQRDGRGLRQGNVVYGPVLDSSGGVIDPGAGIRIFVYLTARSFDRYVFQAIEAKARGFRAILRRSLTVRVVEDVDEVVLSAAQAKALDAERAHRQAHGSSSEASRCLTERHPELPTR